MEQSLRDKSLHRNTILDKLEFLYPGRGEAVNARLQEVLRDFRERHPTPARQTPMFTESDAVLICYADHVREPGTKTLQTMRQFLERYVKGYIGRDHFLPFYPYSSDDGFSVIDYYRVKEEFGDWPDLEEIAKDFQLMFDFVINHVSSQSRWFQGFLAGDPKYQDYFIAFDAPVDVSSVFRPRTHPLLTRFSTRQGEKYVWTTFSVDQIDGNFHNPDVLLEYVRILLFYVDKGASIIRLDAIAYLWKELGTSCIHLPQTHTVVKLLRQILDEVAPNVWIITETNVPHLENISYFGNGTDEAHLVYNFALPPLLLYALITGNATELTRWAKSLRPPSEETAFFNFTASHDGIGVTALRAMLPESEVQRVVDAAQRRGGRIGYRSVPGHDPVPYELNVVYLNAAGGAAPFIASQAVALALQGVPAIYLNSLIGAENWQEGVEKLGYNRAINRQRFAYRDLARELDDPTSTKHRVYDAYARLLRARTTEPLFSPLAGQTILDLHPGVFAILRSRGGDRLLALTNVRDTELKLEAAPLAEALERGQARDILSGEAHSLTDGLSLPPYGVAWLKATH